MTDVLTPNQRRKNMRRIKNRDTKIELVLRKALWRKGYRYRKNYAKLPGKPDIVLLKQRIAIFCDSEFFHGKDWETLKSRLQKCVNSDFWVNKIEKNVKRDLEIDIRLKSMDWIVLRFWGRDILHNTDECIKAVEEAVYEQRIQEYEDSLSEQ